MGMDNRNVFLVSVQKERPAGAGKSVIQPPEEEAEDSSDEESEEARTPPPEEDVREDPQGVLSTRIRRLCVRKRTRCPSASPEVTVFNSHRSWPGGFHTRRSLDGLPVVLYTSLREEGGLLTFAAAQC